MENKGPPKRLPSCIWERKNSENSPSSIFSISSRADISTAIPSSMPEETTVPWKVRRSSVMVRARPGVSLMRWRKVRKLES